MIEFDSMLNLECESNKWSVQFYMNTMLKQHGELMRVNWFDR